MISKHLEKLGKAHKKLEKAHSSLINEQDKKKHVETCNVGLTWDLIDESLSNGDGDPDLPSGRGNYRCGGE